MKTFNEYLESIYQTEFDYDVKFLDTYIDEDRDESGAYAWGDLKIQFNLENDSPEDNPQEYSLKEFLMWSVSDEVKEKIKKLIDSELTHTRIDRFQDVKISSFEKLSAIENHDKITIIAKIKFTA